MSDQNPNPGMLWWGDPVATSSDLPEEGRGDGDARIVTEEDKTMIWSAESKVWLQLMDRRQPTNCEVEAARWIGAARALLGKATFAPEDIPARDELLAHPWPKPEPPWDDYIQAEQDTQTERILKALDVDGHGIEGDCDKCSSNPSLMAPNGKRRLCLECLRAPLLALESVSAMDICSACEGRLDKIGVVRTPDGKGGMRHVQCFPEDQG